MMLGTGRKRVLKCILAINGEVNLINYGGVNLIFSGLFLKMSLYYGQFIKIVWFNGLFTYLN
jgi:hypothetical protein